MGDDDEDDLKEIEKKAEQKHHGHHQRERAEHAAGCLMGQKALDRFVASVAAKRPAKTRSHR